MSAGAERFEPRIVGFLCHWCACSAADKAGLDRALHPPNVHVVRVLCSGRADPQLVLAAFREGADGVLLLACHPGDCHYKEGSCRALQRMALLSRLLSELGVEPGRFRLDFLGAGEGERYARVAGEMVEAVRALGPFVPPP